MTTNEPMKPDVPFELIPTSSPGVFIIPPPPADFDPNTASPDELIKNGILWPRPSEKDDPALRTAWEHIYSGWNERTHIVPEKLEPQIGQIRRPLRNVRQVDRNSYTSPAWAGRFINNTEHGRWVFATGTWRIPTVTVGEPQALDWQSYSWVGLDGWDDPPGTNPSVLQTGAQQLVDTSGNATYRAWYEWYVPNYTGSLDYVKRPKIISEIPVAPGQSVTGTVAYYDDFFGLGPRGSICFSNNDTKQGTPILVLQPPEGAKLLGKCADWIMEVPGGGIPHTMLPKFTPVVFTASNCHSANDTHIIMVMTPSDDDDPHINTVNITGISEEPLTKVYVDPNVPQFLFEGTCTIEYSGLYSGGQKL